MEKGIRPWRPGFSWSTPPIHDFAAFDLFVYPLSLVEVGQRLADAGCSVTLVDALDRFIEAKPAPGEKGPHLPRRRVRSLPAGAEASPLLQSRGFPGFGIVSDSPDPSSMPASPTGAGPTPWS